MLCYTENPKDEMWSYLKVLEVPSNCEKLLRGEIGKRTELYTEPAIVEKKAIEIAHSIKQGREYFNSSDNLSVDTSPLAIFYGILSLAKALIVANEESATLESIKYHGLHSKANGHASLENYKNDPTQWSIEGEYSIVNNGAFLRFAKAIGRDSGIEINGIFRIKDLLPLFPDVSDLYDEISGALSRCVPCDQEGTVKHHQTGEIVGHYFYIPYRYKEKIFTRLPEIATKCKTETLESHVRLDYNGPDIEEFMLYDTYHGQRYIVGRAGFEHNNSIVSTYVSPMLADYILCHILSNCVRYRQEMWVKESATNKFISLIDLNLKHVRRRFPQNILAMLWGEKFWFGPPKIYRW